MTPLPPELIPLALGEPVTLPPDIPHLKQEAERLARSLIETGMFTDWESAGEVLQEVYTSRFLRVLTDLTRHESRFAAAKWLESTGRPGWRFLDGPGPLTAEQSARVLHEACIRARDGTTAIVGVLGPWEAAGFNMIRCRIAMPIASIKADVVCKYGTFEAASTPHEAVTSMIDKMEASALANGWFCL